MSNIKREDAVKAVCEACYMYKYVGEHHKDCKYYPCDDITALEAVPSPKYIWAVMAHVDIDDYLDTDYIVAISDTEEKANTLKEEYLNDLIKKEGYKYYLNDKDTDQIQRNTGYSRYEYINAWVEKYELNKIGGRINGKGI